MTQAERDRLSALKKAEKKLITQKQAAEEIGVTERQVRRMLRRLRGAGDKAVIHALRGQRSNKRLSARTEAEAMGILAQPVYKGFGPTLAAEYLRKKHGLEVSKETLRQWMASARFGQVQPGCLFGIGGLADCFRSQLRRLGFALPFGRDPVRTQLT